LGVQEAVLDSELARQSVDVAREAVKSSEEDLRLAEERYKVGEGTILEVIDAQVNLTRSKTNLVNAAADHRLSVSRLRNAVGDMPVPENGE
jgi:outer membrane protein TolC